MADVPALNMLDPVETIGNHPDANHQIAALIFALVLIDENSRIAEVNQAAEIMLGSSAKRLVGRPLAEVIGLLDPRVGAQLDEVDAALVARDIGIHAGDRNMRVNLTISPLGNFPGWRVVTLSQIGHEEDGSKAELNSTLGAPSILAHEIKNPLAAIRGAGQLAERKLAPQDKKLARMITDEVDRIARLIDRMQQLGSSETGELTPCNLHEAIRSACATVRAADKDGLIFSEEFDPSLPPVYANQDALLQVLINLLSNARDAAAGAQNGQVTIKTRFVSGFAFSAIRLGRSVRLPIEITITDNGEGISPEMRDHVFEPFVSSKPGGQGLGLALVRKMVRDMNGSISHERDTKNNLTHFRLHLPMAKQEQA